MPEKEYGPCMITSCQGSTMMESVVMTPVITTGIKAPTMAKPLDAEEQEQGKEKPAYFPSMLNGATKKLAESFGELGVLLDTIDDALVQAAGLRSKLLHVKTAVENLRKDVAAAALLHCQETQPKAKEQSDG